jgi:deoxyribodipyrimidine photolyase
MSFSSSKECFAEDVSYQEADKDRHQPGGKNTRAWIPELLNVPSEYMHESWHMLEKVMEHGGCVVGKGYPIPPPAQIAPPI